ncbi:hypothetical protein D3C81_1768360 [compost metagenome]
MPRICCRYSTACCSRLTLSRSAMNCSRLCSACSMVANSSLRTKPRDVAPVTMRFVRLQRGSNPAPRLRPVASRCTSGDHPEYCCELSPQAIATRGRLLAVIRLSAADRCPLLVGHYSKHRRKGVSDLSDPDHGAPHFRGKRSPRCSAAPPLRGHAAARGPRTRSRGTPARNVG